MSNSLYDYGRGQFLQAGINWLSDTIKTALVNTSSYTVNTASHQFLADVTAGAFVAPSSGVQAGTTLTSKGATAGAASAANVTFSSVSGSTVGAIIIFKDTGSAATSPLIAYIDTATGLPITPNGGDIIVTWDTGTNKIFKL
jgi:hypothetical protein